MQRNISKRLGIAIDVQRPDRGGGVFAFALSHFDLAEEVLREIRRRYIIHKGRKVSKQGYRDQGLVSPKQATARDEPSEDRDAPDSLNSSPPIWMGNTRSRGRICGILWTSAPVCKGSPAVLGASLGLAESMATSLGEADMDIEKRPSSGV